MLWCHFTVPFTATGLWLLLKYKYLQKVSCLLWSPVTFITCTSHWLKLRGINMFLVFPFWLVLQLNCHVYFWSYNFCRFCALCIRQPEIHCRTVLYSPLCLPGLYLVKKLNQFMLSELMKATALECWISNVCIILFSSDINFRDY